MSTIFHWVPWKCNGCVSGISNREIAKALRIGDSTVRNHVSSILSKLGVSDRTKAVLYALQNHLV